MSLFLVFYVLLHIVTIVVAVILDDVVVAIITIDFYSRHFDIKIVAFVTITNYNNTNHGCNIMNMIKQLLDCTTQIRLFFTRDIVVIGASAAFALDVMVHSYQCKQNTK